MRSHHRADLGSVERRIQPGGERGGDRLRGLVARWIAVAGGLGYVPIAPGTAGSIGGLLVFLAMLAGSGFVGPGEPAGLSRGDFMARYGALLAGLFVLGVWAAGRAEEDFGRSDDGRIVIDEVVGQLATLTPLAWMAAELDFLSLGLGLVTGFVLFRVFDVWKPGLVGWVERRFAGGLGVMMDDGLAGVYGGAALLVLGWLWGGGPVGRGPM